MTLAVVTARALSGISSPTVSVETHLTNGLPGFSIVGLPETAVKESKDRVRSAILNSNLEFPTRKIIVNLAPADIPKEGGRFDLPIAIGIGIGILAASGQIDPQALLGFEFAGELALSGDLRPIKGSLPFAINTKKANRKFIIAIDSAPEAALANDLQVLGARNLLDVVNHFHGCEISRYESTSNTVNNISYPDLEDVRGQHHARRALEIAAAGGHSLLMIGPPGTGKTMLASRLPGILPALNEEEALEVATITSISSGFDIKTWRQRPFRAPHHTASGVALVGGGSNPRPGEISLAHNGVLFLDELAEFDRKVLEVLREPLESKRIIISRAARVAEYPANFQLIAAMNPCPCGHLSNPQKECHCSREQVQRYHAKISGPLLDRIDMHIEVPALSAQLLTDNESAAINAESSRTVKARVVKARNFQTNRSGILNYQLSNKSLQQYCELKPQERLFMESAIEKLKLSARAYHRILRVARTIADLSQAKKISNLHLTEAISYRRLETYSS